MKVLFLYNYYDEKIKSKSRVEFPPLGMLYLCSSLKQNGYEVQVKYFNDNTKESEIPVADVYAFSISATACYVSYKKMRKKLKNREGIFVSGNTHTTIFPKQVLNDLNLNAVFIGEGEITVPKMLININTNDKIIIEGECADVNNIPFPARNLIPSDKIYMNNRVGGTSNNSISITSSRGCVFQCQFCAIQNKKKVRFRTKENFEAEIVHILKNYPKCDGITLLDETFTLKTSHALNIIDVLNKYNLKWECNSRVDTLNETIIEALSKSRCQEIRLGIESGSQRLVDKMHKGINIEKSKLAIKKLALMGIPVKIYLMHGFPGENKETTIETIRYLDEMRDFLHRISLYRFVPLPGSPIYSNGSINKLNWEDYTIYDNNNHWWGNKEEFNEMNAAYFELEEYVLKFNRGS